MTIQPSALSTDALVQAAECLRTLAHPSRLLMVDLLLRQEATVGELAGACGLASHQASEHLGVMKDRRLLASERRGRNVFYRIAEPGLEHIMACIRERFGSASS